MAGVRRPGEPPAAVVLAGSAVLVVAVACVDYATGIELRVFPLYWFVTSWWNWISLRLTRAPSALAQRSAEASFSSAYFSCTVSPSSSCAYLLPLNRRIAS